MNTRMAALGCGLAFALAGCAGSGSELTTAGVLGEEKKPGNLAMQSTATGRAIQVGSVAARAVKCGFNFDPAKLKSAFLGREAQAGLGVDELAKTEKVYGVAYSGVAKGVQGDSASLHRSQIRRDQVRPHPPPRRRFLPAPPREKADDSIWASFFDNASVENGPKFGSQEWWDRQKDKSGL